MASAAKRRTTNGSRRNQYRYATDGSAARQLEAIPERQQKSRRQREYEQAHRQKKVQHVKVKPKLLNPLSLLIFGAAIVATIYVCVVYVQLQAEIIVHLKNINAYEVELNDIVAQNNELEARINSYIDLQYIYQVATEELGMIYPQRGQISEYENSGSEYVRQYGTIPEVPKTTISVGER